MGLKAGSAQSLRSEIKVSTNRVYLCWRILFAFSMSPVLTTPFSSLPWRSRRCSRPTVRRFGLSLGLMMGVGCWGFASTITPPAWATPGEAATRTSVVQITPLLSPNQFDRTTLMREANRYLREQNYSDAETLFLQLIDRDPRDAVLHYKLGLVLAAQYRDTEAEAAYRRAIDLENRYVLALYGLGELYSSQSRWDEALALFEQATQIEASYTEAQLGRGQALWQLGRDREAIEVLEITVEQLVDQDQLWQAIGVANLIHQIERMRDVV
ncbi:MAG: tetratricopeptide repeat protein [Oscillatoriales cyanobacterium]|nr:MAG: tetratricopeptide repeat protein [Oscillatoriales cyanobacterium]